MGTNQNIQLSGGERVALVGDSGVGKTSLLRTLLQPDEPARKPARGELITQRVGHLDQNLALDEVATVLENVRQAASSRKLPHDIRVQLARSLMHGDMVDRLVGWPPGGERFRVALARMRLALARFGNFRVGLHTHMFTNLQGSSTRGCGTLR